MWLVTPLFPRWDLGHPSQRNELEDKGCFHGAQAAGQTWEVRGRAGSRRPSATPPWGGGQQAGWGPGKLGQQWGPATAFPPTLGLFQSHLKQGQGRVQRGNGEIFRKLNRTCFKKKVFLKKASLGLKSNDN